MTDEELLDYVEAKTFEEMLGGCEIDDHLGEKMCYTGAWAVTFRADTICRLIDMAREAKLKQKNGYEEKNTRQDGNCKHCVNGCHACDARRQSNVLP